MHWILQDNLFNESAYQTLVDVLDRFRIPYSIHKVIPFVGELTPEPSFDTRNIICMGSYSLRHSAKKFGWYPGVFDLEPFDFSHQLKHWGDEMLNADSVVSRFEEVVFTEEEMFARPVQDSKVFAGGVFSKTDFEEWQRKVCVLEEDYGNSLTKNTLVQVSRLKKIHAEYRFWIVKQEIVTASLYKRGRSVIYASEVDERIFTYVRKILNTKDRKESPLSFAGNDGWAPHDAFVIDVAETAEGLRVVEINTINSCGFYAADIQKLVVELESTFSDRP